MTVSPAPHIKSLLRASYTVLGHTRITSGNGQGAGADGWFARGDLWGIGPIAPRGRVRSAILGAVADRDQDAVYIPNSFRSVVTISMPCPETGEKVELSGAPDPLTLAREGWTYDCSSCSGRHTITTETFGRPGVG